MTEVASSWFMAQTREAEADEVPDVETLGLPLVDDVRSGSSGGVGQPAVGYDARRLVDDQPQGRAELVGSEAGLLELVDVLLREVVELVEGD